MSSEKKPDPAMLRAIMIAAVKGGSIEKVKELAAFDKSLIHARDEKGHSAVQIAAESIGWQSPRHAEIARFLTEQGADCDIFLAARAGLLDHVNRLLDSYPHLLTATDTSGRTALQRAAVVSAPSAEGEAVAEFLVSRGATVDIFTACVFGLADRVESLLKSDPSLVKARCSGGTPLHWAVRPHRNSGAAKQICALLLDAGAQIEAVDLEEHGMSALHHVAEWSNDTALAELLLARGAELDDKCNEGHTALEYAITHKRAEMAAFLRARGAKPATIQTRGISGARAGEMIAATRKGDIDGVIVLLRENPGLVNTRGDCGETPLHWAAQAGNMLLAELLLKKGADVGAEATLKFGGTPLLWGAERQPEMVALLLAHGADVRDFNSRNGQSALHCCARCNNSAEMAELLIAKGADINARDNSGKTPLRYAEDFEHDQVADVLRKFKARDF
jgi:ankyrin repeat protein